MSSPTLALKLDHLAFPILEVEASRVFYTETLGLSLLEAHAGDDWGGFPWLMMIFGLHDGRQLALIALSGAKPEKSALPSDAQHIAFTVGSAPELEAWKARLQKAGVAFSEEDHGRQRSLYFQDPNAITLELTTPAPAASEDAGAAAVIAHFLATSS